jgi:hypothetical protein
MSLYLSTINPIVCTNLMQGYTTTATAAGTTVLTSTSTYGQYFTGSTTQTVTLPAVSTLKNGYGYEINNSSTGAVTVQTATAATVQVVGAGNSAVITCINTSGTNAAGDWYVHATSTGSVTLAGDVTGSAGANSVVKISGPNGSGTGLPISSTSGATSSIYFGYSGSLPTGTTNVGIGYQALNVNTTGFANVAIGVQALRVNTTGDTNTAIGTNALNNNTTGTRNTAVGNGAGAALVSGSSNTIVGASAGSVITSGGNNTLIGAGATTDVGTRSGATVLGQGITATVDNGLFVKHRATTANTAAGFITGTNELVETTVPIGGTSTSDYAYAYDTTSTQVITVANTWYDVTFDTNSILTTWTHGAGTADFTCASTGRYLIRANVSFSKTAANVESGIRLVIVTAGPTVTEVVSSLQHYHMHTSATDHTVGVIDMPVAINAGDILRLQVACDTGATVNLAAGTGFWATQPSARMQITRFV